MVSSFTANKKPRSDDEYAPGGKRSLCVRADGSIGPGIRARPNARPDRAVISYSTMCRQAFKGVPVIIGGIEASLRRLPRRYLVGHPGKILTPDSRPDH